MKRKVCTPVDMLQHVKVTGNVWDHLFLHIIHEVHILHTPAGWKFLIINNFTYTCNHTKTFSCLFLFCSRVRKHLLHHVWPVVMLYWHDHFIIVQIHNVLISAMTLHSLFILVLCSSTSLVHISEEAIIDWDVLISPQLHLMPETWNTNNKWWRRRCNLSDGWYMYRFWRRGMFGWKPASVVGLTSNTPRDV